MPDFTIKLLPKLYKALQSQSFSFISVSDILQNQKISSKYLILRHDVEKYYENALEFARIQNELGIRGVYYFRISEKHFKPAIIKQIDKLGHEAGYHYDDLTQCNGNYNLAIKRFEKNLNMLRDIVQVKTICMDGSPLSRYDNRNLWRGRGEEIRMVKGRFRTEKPERPRDKEQMNQSGTRSYYDYRDFSIIGEPYFDIDFSEVFYITDTGRRWDGDKFNLRDKALKPVKSKPIHRYRSTHDIIDSVSSGDFPQKAMLTFHPQRWTNKPLPWVKELVFQNIKNWGKFFLLNMRK